MSLWKLHFSHRYQHLKLRALFCQMIEHAPGFVNWLNSTDFSQPIASIFLECIEREHRHKMDKGLKNKKTVKKGGDLLQPSFMLLNCLEITVVDFIEWLSDLPTNLSVAKWRVVKCCNGNLQLQPTKTHTYRLNIVNVICWLDGYSFGINWKGNR